MTKQKLSITIAYKDIIGIVCPNSVSLLTVSAVPI